MSPDQAKVLKAVKKLKGKGGYLPPRRTIASESGIPAGSVYAALKALDKAGYIEYQSYRQGVKPRVVVK